jgi:D-psicose/D-tagatose/L-ribulose 3-epimerase
MPLAVSNIAWTNPEDPAILEILRRQGVAGIEIAPTKIWPSWKGATPEAARALRRSVSDFGFQIPSMQAILFDQPDCQLFGDKRQRTAFIDHIRFTADLAAEMCASVMVFGAPKNRARNGIPAQEAFKIAVETFGVVGDECAMRGTACCIEPNPPMYGCDFVTTSPEGLALVEAVSSGGFGLHLDAAAMFLAGEDGPTAVRRCAAALCHFHASEPQLGTFDSPTIGHAALSEALLEIGYPGWISIEMRPSQDEAAAVSRACEFVRENYGPLLGNTVTKNPD